MHLSMMFLWAFALVLVVHAAPRPGYEDTTSSSAHVYSSATHSGSSSHLYSSGHSTPSSIIHVYSSTSKVSSAVAHSESSSQHYSTGHSHPSSSIHVYSSATHSESPSHHSSIPLSGTPHSTKSTHHYTSVPSPTCHPKIETYLIKVEHESLKEFTYLIYTPPDHSSSISYPFGSIGDTILKPDTFAATFWLFSGDLKKDTAALAQYPKAYPHHHPPSAKQAEYYFIIIGESAPVGISHTLPANVGYLKFGTDEYAHLTFAGLQKWAVCSTAGKDSTATKYVYWLGNGECPDNCIVNVTLKLVPYGFPFEHDYYHEDTKSTYGKSTYPSESCSTVGYETSSSSCAPTDTLPTLTSSHGGEPTSCEETSTSSYSYGGGKGVYTSSVGSHPYTSSESCSESETSPKSTYTTSKTWTTSDTDTKPTKYASSETCTDSDTHPTPTVYTSSESCSESESSPKSTYTSSKTWTPSDTDTKSTKYASSETCTESDAHPTLTVSYTSYESCSESETSPTSTVYGGSHHSSYYPDEYEDCDDDDYSYYGSYYSHYRPTSTTSECTSSTTRSSAKVYLTSTPKTNVVHYSTSVLSSSKPQSAAY